MRAPKEILHKLQFFVELLRDGICGAEFVEQSQTPMCRTFGVPSQKKKSYTSFGELHRLQKFCHAVIRRA